MRELQTCTLCKKAHRVPQDSHENMCSVEITHHYGSPRDGNIETYTVCFQCVLKLFKNKPDHIRNYLTQI